MSAIDPDKEPAAARGMRIVEPPQADPASEDQDRRPIEILRCSYRPPDADFYPRGTRVEHDPAFIEPFAGSYQTSTASGRYGLSGWTAPNPPVGAESTNWKEVNGWFALGFSVTWDGPPARVVPAQRPR